MKDLNGEAARTIYLAGKISNGGMAWREEIIDGLSSIELTDGEEWPVLFGAVADRLDYVGPYLVDMAGGHGWFVHEICLEAIERADVVFAWLDDPTAYGTLVELGYAKALGKRIVVAVPGVVRDHDGDRDDLWFAHAIADVVIEAPEAGAAMTTLIGQMFPALESPIEERFWNAHLTLRIPAIAGLIPQYNILGGRYRLDFALPQDKIGIELDGYEYHSSKEAFTKDRERQRQIEATGWRIIRFSGSEVYADAEACVRQAAGLVGAFKSGLAA